MAFYYVKHNPDKLKLFKKVGLFMLDKKNISLLGKVLLLITISFSLVIPVKAQDLTEKTLVKVTNFEIQTTEGQPVNNMTLGTFYSLKLSWDATMYGNTLMAGDYFKIQLPEQMQFPTNHSACNFPLFDESGNVVANAVVNSNGAAGGGEITVTFTDYVEGRYNIKGDLYLSCRAILEKIVLNEVNTFTLLINGQSVETSVIVSGSGPQPTDPEQILSKWASKSNSTDERIQWNAWINFAKKTIDNCVIGDSLSSEGDISGIQYIPESFILSEREVDEYSNIISTGRIWRYDELKDKLTFNDDFTSFELDMGDIPGQTYLFQYYTTNKPGVSLKNKLQLRADLYSATVTANYTNPTSGGSGAGDLNEKLKIVKVDKDDNTIALAGATFSIVRVSDGTMFELTTDVNGEAISNKLVAGDYLVTEVSAPAGYEINTDIHEVKIENGKLFTLTVENERFKTSVPVYKHWIGQEANEVIVHLTIDGVDTGKSLTLNANNNWHDTFENLDMYDDIGELIGYGIYEEPITGYAVDAYEDSAGWHIVNTNVKTIQIPVRKVWTDAVLERVIVNLLADGQVVAETELNANNNWQYTFENLPKYDPTDGHGIVYDVQEEPIEDCVSQREGNVENGFTFTNTIYSQELINIPVRKVWTNVVLDRCIINLLVDGVVVEEVELNSRNNWTYTFENLRKVDKDDGHEYLYEIAEEPIEKCSVEIRGDAQEGFTVYNTIVEDPPKTGDNQKLWLFVSLLVISSTLAYVVYTKSKKD